MCSLRVTLFSMLVASASVTPSARAQWSTDHRWDRDRGELWIEGFAPASAGPGDRVLIEGGAFGPATQVFVGGHRAAIESIRHDAIVVVVPGEVGDGRIVVREPRSGDRIAGVLRPEPEYPPPVLERVRVDPRRHGTRLVIEGYRFLPDDGVLVGGVPVETQGADDRRLVAIVPPGVAGPVAVLRVRDGRRYDTGVILPARHRGPRAAYVLPPVGYVVPGVPFGPPGARIVPRPGYVVPRAYPTRPVRHWAGPRDRDEHERWERDQRDRGEREERWGRDERGRWDREARDVAEREERWRREDREREEREHHDDDDDRDRDRDRERARPTWPYPLPYGPRP